MPRTLTPEESRLISRAERAADRKNDPELAERVAMVRTELAGSANTAVVTALIGLVRERLTHTGSGERQIITPSKQYSFLGNTFC